MSITETPAPLPKPSEASFYLSSLPADEEKALRAGLAKGFAELNRGEGLTPLEALAKLPNA